MSSTTESSSPNKPLAGKVAIVTGAARGLGAAMAKRLAADGAKVAVNYVKSAEAAEAVVEEIKKQGGEARAFQADVAQRDKVHELVKEVVHLWGRLDIFVNNGAVSGAETIEKATEEVVDKIFNINVKGTLWGIQAAASVLQSGGSIINISSGITRTAIPTFGVYAASKAAVDHLTKTAAKELGPRGIRVNSINPGAILTDMAEEVLTPAAIQQLKDQTPLEHRLGTPEEIANAVAFLASPASSWITAESIALTGGQV